MLDHITIHAVICVRKLPIMKSQVIEKLHLLKLPIKYSLKNVSFHWISWSSQNLSQMHSFVNWIKPYLKVFSQLSFIFLHIDLSYCFIRLVIRNAVKWGVLGRLQGPDAGVRPQKAITTEGEPWQLLLCQCNSQFNFYFIFIQIWNHVTLMVESAVNQHLNQLFTLVNAVFTH